MEARIERVDDGERMRRAISWQVVVMVGLLFVIALTQISSRNVSNLIWIIALSMVFMGLRRPAYIVAAILLVELTIATNPASKLIAAGINPRYIVTWLGVGIILFQATRASGRLKLSVGPGLGAYPLIVAGVLFVSLVVLASRTMAVAARPRQRVFEAA